VTRVIGVEEGIVEECAQSAKTKQDGEFYTREKDMKGGGAGFVLPSTVLRKKSSSLFAFNQDL
jgi:hypothetical protein